jgi:hypothetical protein
MVQNWADYSIFITVNAGLFALAHPRMLPVIQKPANKAWPDGVSSLFSPQTPT